MMTRDWEAEFKELTERERRAFAKLGQALYKVGGNAPAAVIDEMSKPTPNGELQKRLWQSL